MKKTKKKLEFYKETVRKLLDYELKLVGGGAPFADTPMTESCPPCGSDDDCGGGRL